MLAGPAHTAPKGPVVQGHHVHVGVPGVGVMDTDTHIAGDSPVPGPRLVSNNGSNGQITFSNLGSNTGSSGLLTNSQLGLNGDTEHAQPRKITDSSPKFDPVELSRESLPVSGGPAPDILLSPGELATIVAELRRDLDQERRLRHETASLAAVNAESLRRLQRSVNIRSEG